MASWTPVCTTFAGGIAGCPRSAERCTRTPLPWISYRSAPATQCALIVRERRSLDDLLGLISPMALWEPLGMPLREQYNDYPSGSKE